MTKKESEIVRKYLYLNLKEEIEIQVALDREKNQFERVELAARYSKQMDINTELNCLASDLGLDTNAIRLDAWNSVRGEI